MSEAENKTRPNKGSSFYDSQQILSFLSILLMMSGQQKRYDVEVLRYSMPML